MPLLFGPTKTNPLLLTGLILLSMTPVSYRPLTSHPLVLLSFHKPIRECVTIGVTYPLPRTFADILHLKPVSAKEKSNRLSALNERRLER